MQSFKNKRGILAVRSDVSAAELVGQIKAGFEAFKLMQAETDTRIEAFAKAQAEGATAEAKAALKAAEDSARQVQALADRLVEAEQKLVAGVLRGTEPPKSLGALVITSEAFKQFQSGATNKMRIEANTITGQSGSPASNNDTLTQSQRLPGIIGGAFRQLRIRDVLPSGNTSSNIVEFTRELAFTNNAAETAEGATKPETDVTFELANAPVRTIAHWIKLSRQVMDDAPAVASYVDTRLRYGVERRIDAQLIAGNGSGQNLSGLTASGNYTAFTPETGDTALDSLNRAKYLIEAAEYSATAIVMNPANWGAIERLKDGSDRYLVGDPHSAIGPVLWGLPVIVSNSMTADKLLVGAFDIAAQVWNREGVAVEMTESNDTDFVKNLVTVRAEARLALAIYRPASIYYGDLTV